MAQKVYLCLLFVFLGACINSALSQEQVIPAASIPPDQVTAFSANRTNRLFHNLFHNIRMNWVLLDEIEQRELANLGWKPAYVSFTYINGDINQPVMLMGPTGEDFLWMHYQMINEVDRIAEAIVPAVTWRVDGWLDCPTPTDTTWPVPPVPTSIVDNIPSYAAYLQEYKTDDFYNTMIKPKEDKMKEVAYLRSLTLGEFGTLIEYELHTYFHVRFSAYNPIGYRLQSLHPTAAIGTEWDDPEYDYLADFYSAHVNPTFWKIHGWIERKMEEWSSAHGGSYTAKGNVNDLPWTSQWEMGPMDPTILTELEGVAARAEARGGKIDGKKNDAGVIVGSVFGGIVLGFIIAFIAFVCMLKMKTKGQQQNAKNTKESKPLKGNHSQANQDENIEVGKH